MLLSEGARGVSEMRRALHVARQGCCAWRKRRPSAHGERGAGLAGEISEIHAAGRGICGAPKVLAELKRAGEPASRRRAARIMRDNGRVGTTRGCAKRPKGEAKAAAPQADSAPDPVRRGFSADGPSRAWFAGIACVRTHRGRLYLAVVMGIWSRMIVGRPMPDRMAAGLADDAPRMAMARRHPKEGRIHHSDHGPRCVSLLLGKTMREAGTGPSMGSISSPWDNAAMESPMGLIRAERVHARTFETREQAALEIFECIGCLCNRVRIHSAPGNLSPAEFEARNMEGAVKMAA